MTGIGDLELATRMYHQSHDGPDEAYHATVTAGVGWVLEGQEKLRDAYHKLSLRLEPLASVELGPEDGHGALVQSARAMLEAVETGLVELRRPPGQSTGP